MVLLATKRRRHAFAICVRSYLSEINLLLGEIRNYVIYVCACLLLAFAFYARILVVKPINSFLRTQNRTSTPIGAWKCNFSPFKENYGHSKWMKSTFTFTNKIGVFYPYIYRMSKMHWLSSDHIYMYKNCNRRMK